MGEGANLSRRGMVLGAPLLMAGCAQTGSGYSSGNRVAPVVALEASLPPLPVSIALPSFPQTFLDDLPDASLRRLAGETLPRSPIVRQALYTVAQASAEASAAGARRGPRLSAEVGGGAVDTDGYATTKLRPTLLGGLQGGFTIWDNGAGALREDKARWAVAVAASQLWERVEAVCFNVCEAAFARARAVALLKVSDGTVAQFEATLRAVRTQVEAGVSPASDVPEAEARLERVKAGRVTTRASMEDAETRLRRTTGRVVVPVLDLPVVPLPVGTPEERAEGHPSVQAADSDIRACIKAVLAVDAERLGSVAVGFGPSGFLSAFSGGGVWALGTAFVRASIPLFDSGERSARLRSAVASLEISLARRNDGALAVAGSIREAETAARAAMGLETAAVREGAATDRLLAQKVADWRVGTSDLRVILDAQQAKWDSVSRAEAARWDRKVAAVRILATSGMLARAMGIVEGQQIDMLSDEPFKIASALLKD